jgi:D-sedoheptulose 7-phosphate isomerase
MNFFKNFFLGSEKISRNINIKELDILVKELKQLKKNKGRIFFLGVGGSAGNCSHAVNDFRKLCRIEAYSPTDNVSELTARINDEGWDSSFQKWLEISNLNKKDALFIFSVGGGDKKRNISVNLIEAVKYAKKIKAKVFGIIGRKEGYVKQAGDNVIVIPEVNRSLITPYSESFQALIWHALVSHPELQSSKTKW